MFTCGEGGVPGLGAVLDPQQVDVAERVAGDARGPEVKVLVDVVVEEGVQVHECFGRGRFDGVPNRDVKCCFGPMTFFSIGPDIRQTTRYCRMIRQYTVRHADYSASGKKKIEPAQPFLEKYSNSL